MFISAYGWRDLYFAIGAIGMSVGALTFSLVSEPERGKFLQGSPIIASEEITEEPNLEVENSNQQNPISKFFTNFADVYKQPMEGNILIGHSIRYMGTCALYAYMPIVFGLNFPEYKQQFSTINALLVAGFGMTTSIMEGVVIDRFESKNRWTNTIINIS